MIAINKLKLNSYQFHKKAMAFAAVVLAPL